jgi:hypothetical protein
MRSFVTLFILFIGSLQLQAQITIEKSDFTVEAGMVVVGWNLDFANTAIPEDGEGMVWDFSDLSLSGTILSDFSTSSNSIFSDANLKAPTLRPTLGGVANQLGEAYYLLDDTGYGSIGQIFEPLDVPLVTFTGGAEDELKVLETVRDFMGRQSTIQFPLNFGDSWTYDATTQTDYLVTVAAFALQNTPAGQITRDSAELSVAGYGTLILPNPDGSDPVSVEALMVKRTRKAIFDYTLGGQPAPQLMLDLFGLQQGEEQNVTRYFFYAKGLPRSAANIRVNGQGNIDQFTISDELKNLVTSTSEAATALAPVKAFPNPIMAGDILSIHSPVEVARGNFELINTFGQLVASWPVNAVQNETLRFALPMSMQSGTYLYRITDDNKEVRGTGKLNVVR